MGQLEQDDRFDRKREIDDADMDDRDLWETQYDNDFDQDGEDDDDE